MGRRFETREIALACLLCVVGLVAWLHWSITDPSFDQTEAQSEWVHVLGFSALVLALMGGAAALGRALSDAGAVRRISLILLIAGVLAAVTNVVEDGLGVEEAFIVFVVLTGVELLALAGLGLALSLVVRGPRRVLALVPLATVTGVILYVPAGGPILLGTWCAAAVLLLVTRSDAGTTARPLMQPR
jgi:hypothetical protein